MRQTLDIRTKHRIRRFFYGKVAILVLLTLIAVATHASWGMYQKGKEAKERNLGAAVELERLEAREIELEREIAHIESPRGIESELRERYMIVKDGEHVMVVNDATTKEEDTTLESTIPWWKKLLGAIGIK